MEIIPPWDMAFLDRMDLNERRKMVADGAISAYKTAVLCTMMVDYDMIPGGALERLTDELSRTLEEERSRSKSLRRSI